MVNVSSCVIGDKMFSATEKVCGEIKQIIDKSERYAHIKDKGGEIYVRLGIIPEGDDFAYTFQFDGEMSNSDVLVELYGVIFLYSSEHASKFNKINLDFLDDETRRGIVFKEENG